MDQERKFTVEELKKISGGNLEAFNAYTYELMEKYQCQFPFEIVQVATQEEYDKLYEIAQEKA